jgi:fructose-1,6-bisphosphatase/inositol monophosphatase family enzyme
MFWDVAAGLALVQAAGGIVKIKNIKQMDSPINVVATNSFLRIDDKKIT